MENDIWVPNVHNECLTELRYAFDFQVKLRCQMVMDWYPYDQNICHVKLGSYSHSSEDLVFAQGEKTSEHTFTQTSYKDYKFKVLPLCAHAMEETIVDVGGETSVDKVSRFILVITRMSSKVLAEYIIGHLVQVLARKHWKWQTKSSSCFGSWPSWCSL